MNSLPSNSTIIFFSPHPDDEIISAGALMFDMVQKQNEVIVCYFDNSPKGIVGDQTLEEKLKIRKDEAVRACKVIGASPRFLNIDKQNLSTSKENIDLVSRLIDDNMPSFVITTNPSEAHQAHQIVAKIVEMGAEKSQQKPEIWYSEVWSTISNPDYWHSFDSKTADAKIKALEEYKTQIHRTNWIEAQMGLNRYRAITSYEILNGFGSTTPKDAPKYTEVLKINKNR